MDRHPSGFSMGLGELQNTAWALGQAGELEHAERLRNVSGLVESGFQPGYAFGPLEAKQIIDALKTILDRPELPAFHLARARGTVASYETLASSTRLGRLGRQALRGSD